MSDIVINDVTYEGVETITAQTTDGGTATFTELGETSSSPLYQHSIYIESTMYAQLRLFFTIITQDSFAYDSSTLGNAYSYDKYPGNVVASGVYSNSSEWIVICSVKTLETMPNALYYKGYRLSDATASNMGSSETLVEFSNTNYTISDSVSRII